MSLYKRDLNMECHLRRFSNTKGYPSKTQSARKRVTFYNNMGQYIRPRITFGLPIEPRFGKQYRVRKLPQTFQILWKSDVKPFGKHGVIGDNFWFQWNPTNRACHRCPHEFDWAVLRLVFGVVWGHRQWVGRCRPNTMGCFRRFSIFPQQFVPHCREHSPCLKG